MNVFTMFYIIFYLFPNKTPHWSQKSKSILYFVSQKQCRFMEQLQNKKMAAFSRVVVCSRIKGNTLHVPLHVYFIAQEAFHVCRRILCFVIKRLKLFYFSVKYHGLIHYFVCKTESFSNPKFILIFNSICCRNIRVLFYF